MEPLNLHTGRFVPRVETDSEARIRALEAHLSGLSADLEHVLAQINATLELLVTSTRAAASNDGMDL